MTPPEPAGLSRSEKQELLRKILVERISRTRTEPASFAQERLWFINRLQPDNDFYNISLALRLAGPLDAGALERALGEIVRRHETLRTTFQEREGGPVQVIAPFAGFALPAEDVPGGDGAEREAEARRLATAEARRPFDLAVGPLFRTRLLRLGAEEHVLLVTLHHIVTDEWSMGVLFRELGALYGAFREGRDSPLPALSIQYADYAVQQRARLRGEALERQLAYWKAQLAGAPALLELPTDRPRPAVRSSRGASERMELPGELLERLRALGQREGATLFMTLLGAFGVLLARYAGSDDVVVGSSIAGRTRRETEGLIGFFVNTLVLRTDLGGDPTFRETLRRVRETMLGAYDHQELPFEKLVAELQPERSLSHSPLFQVAFALRDAGSAGAGLAGLRVDWMPAGSETVNHDLGLVFAETGGGLRAILGFSTDLFERATIRRMLGHLARVLEQAAERPEL
ncbi:MAG TPA: condensation domain-containing protein, partial [Longimicrobiaceae bacterium]|nr:condensation domain-containing protein [Longimicrobiaceae bacterium]